MRSLNYRHKLHLALACFLAPAVLVYGVLFLGPVLSSLYYSFTNWNGINQTMSFVGLRNYSDLLSDKAFLAALQNTLKFAVLVVILQNAMAIPLAIVLDAGIRSRNLLRVIFFSPAVLSPLVVGYTWLYIYEPNQGVLNTLLRQFGLDAWTQSWLGDPQIALISIVGIVIWQYTGYSMVIYLANLQTIPKDLYESAGMDGAGKRHQFWHITFPLLAPAMTINIVLSTIGTLKAFDIVYVTTKGGPYHATETMSTLMFSTAFGSDSFGYGTAIGVVIFAIIMGISLLQLAILRRREVAF
ncbi:sugar ABC transporter permease [Paenibacillus sp. HWE-109]|uniref:carbohydrate ABC transporter permease n=1 Tax=Paenibacillus sp. HWE-109 TaxID=1306526 RepID=UPI001EDE29D1|nr:sugar ABC transporter permease [Paenibacillus sp. HWE-109]UKS27951.1 sugar ABC transporter permease [Paenibacillus sp. HWE-109]